ncbi:hypothetical protein [Streptomyces geranii]|uniref:hypothetical protein n=1 Tax=Streptomyces geranii TaxID=2058923 RepID=UPI001E2B5380|nr:hypothetical protein [Streptomyces geranii]
MVHIDDYRIAVIYDFGLLPVPDSLQRSLAALFASRCRRKWKSLRTSGQVWTYVKVFADFLSQQDPCPQDLDQLTAGLLRQWRMSRQVTVSGATTLETVRSLLRDDSRLQSGPVADELARIVRKPVRRQESFEDEELEAVRRAARPLFRSALLRIEENARHLERWHAGEFADGSREWTIGECLEHLARTGSVPTYVLPSNQRTIRSKYITALGGTSPQVTWQRLYLSRMEAASLAVLLMTEFGWNLSVIDRLAVPQAAADQGADGRPTYTVGLVKPRRGPGNWFESENVTDLGANSPGRLVTQALAATRFARASVERRAPGTDRLIVSRMSRPNHRHAVTRAAPVGPFAFGVSDSDVVRWAEAAGLAGSPFRRGRRTVTVQRREPAQHSRATNERHYVLADKRAQREAIPVIAQGAEEAVRQAKATILAAVLRDAPEPSDVETATADCSDPEASPWPAAGGGCGASFLLCLACTNAHVHPGHHPRLTHLHQCLGHLHSVLSPAAWARDWENHHARLADLKRKLGDGVWRQALARVTDRDRHIVDLLLNGVLNP